ncbi:MAG: hypothetical protein FWD31_06895 [Planctomycetaceae bacterium]|nr:hypothetical protein [Planctomycetaceae bacterium]
MRLDNKRRFILRDAGVQCKSRQVVHDMMREGGTVRNSGSFVKIDTVAFLDGAAAR